MEAYDFADYVRQTLHQIVKSLRNQPDYYPPDKIIVIQRPISADGEIRVMMSRDLIQPSDLQAGNLLELNSAISIEITNPEKIRRWLATTHPRHRQYWIRIQCPAQIPECRWITVLLSRSPMFSFKCQIFYPRLFTGTYIEEEFPSPVIINPLEI